MTRGSAPRKGASSIDAHQHDRDQTTASAMSPGEVELLWQEHERLHLLRTADPEARRAIRDRLPSLPPELAAEIEAELEQVRPAVVLHAHWKELVLDRPALGAFPRRDTLAAPIAAEWLGEDPGRLVWVVREMARFGHPDWHRIAEAVAAIADGADIAEAVADPLIAGAIRALRDGGQRVS